MRHDRDNGNDRDNNDRDPVATVNSGRVQVRMPIVFIVFIVGMCISVTFRVVDLT